jgi:hypothetical protein
VGTVPGKGRVFSSLKKKEAKKTLSIGRVPGRLARAPVGKVFWLFFSKKNMLS